MKMTALEQDFCEFFGKTGQVYGMDSLCTGIIGTLYLETGDIAMGDIAKRTGYSLASISNKMKSLETMGIVQRVHKPGTKKAFFKMEKDLFKLNQSKLQAVLNNSIVYAKEELPQIINRHKHGAKGEDAKRIKIIENYYNQIIQFEEVMKKFITGLEKISK